MKRLIAGSMLLLVLGCATVALSPQAERVRMVSDANVVADCKILGVVDVTTDETVTAETNLNELRNKAAALGADTILMKYSRLTGFYGTSATAYQCAQQK